MHRTLRRLATAGAACVALICAAPAAAHEVTVVDGSHVYQRNYRFVPARGAADIGIPPRGPVAVHSSSAKATSKRGQRAVDEALLEARKRNAISKTADKRYRYYYRLARLRYKRLSGTRQRELGGVITNLEQIALRGQLTAGRMPALFLIMRRNVEFWPHSPLPSNRAYITFRGSEILFEYYVGEGLQLQPLANFKKANALHGACVKKTGPCREAGLKLLLRELVRTSTPRGSIKRAWEYYFDFGGGSPPWISGMATATAIQAFGRSSQLLGDNRYRTYAGQAFKAFSTAPPTGIKTTGPLGGIHYLQYSFAPRLYIINAFLQSIIGLYDYAEITGDKTASKLWKQAEPEARKELPRNDTGDWSTYSFGGAESTREYFELLREFSASLCSRLHTAAYCTASKHFSSYTRDPAKLSILGPGSASRGRATRVNFSLSKLSDVQVTVTHAGKTVFDRTAQFRRGNGSVSWTPRATGEHTIHVVAKELRTGKSLRTRKAKTIDVAAP